jgi:hypothetical protein
MFNFNFTTGPFNLLCSRNRPYATNSNRFELPGRMGVNDSQSGNSGDPNASSAPTVRFQEV